MLISFDPGTFSVFLQVVMIDLVLAGDNAVVIGLAAASLEPSLRRKAILLGIVAATIFRIVLALMATYLLTVIGLLLAGGLLLLWVCWKMWQELREAAHQRSSAGALTAGQGDGLETGTIASRNKKNFRQSVIHILIADISMSLDNVLAVAGAAREHPVVLAFGLLLSIALMGLAATYIADLLNKHRWIAYVGLAIIFIVAAKMIFTGADEVIQSLL